MKSNIEKLQSSKELTKVLLTSQIFAINGKEFSIQLKRAELFAKASENWELQSTKDELKRLNITFKDKYAYFAETFGVKKSQTALLIRVGNMKTEDIQSYIELKGDKANLTDLDEWRKGDKENDVNTTLTQPTEKTQTLKPLTFKSDKKGIEIKVNGMLTAQEKKDALAFIKGLTTI